MQRSNVRLLEIHNLWEARVQLSKFPAGSSFAHIFSIVSRFSDLSNTVHTIYQTEENAKIKNYLPFAVSLTMTTTTTTVETESHPR